MARKPSGPFDRPSRDRAREAAQQTLQIGLALLRAHRGNRLEPTHDVSVPLTSTDVSEGDVVASALFTPTTWDVDQVVSVTGVDDSDSDGHQNYSITFDAATSDDPVYSGAIHTASLTVQNRDNDGGRLDLSIIFDSEHEGETAGLRVLESGGRVVACDNTQIITSNAAAFVIEGIFVVDDTYTVELFAGRDGNTTFDALQDHPLLANTTVAGESDLVVSDALETDFLIIGVTWPSGTGCDD